MPLETVLKATQSNKGLEQLFFLLRGAQREVPDKYICFFCETDAEPGGSQRPPQAC